MSKIKRFTLRGIRKSVHLFNKASSKVLSFSTRVEGKATRILNGTDYSISLDDSVPFEKLYYSSLRCITPLNPALPGINQQASIVLLLPSLNKGAFFGGTATALVIAAKLAKHKQRPLRIVQTLETGKVPDLSAFFKSEGIDMPEDAITITSVADRAYNVYGYIPMHRDDIFIASAWWDAYLLDKLPLTQKYIYLIQDFEPIFYNNSDSYVLAESTYKSSRYIALCNTELMYNFMKDRHYPAFEDSTAYWFEPAVSRIKSGTVMKKGPGEKKRLFLYGRPNVHRNLFFTALEAIDRSFIAGYLNKHEWEVYMAGQDGLPGIKLSSGVSVNNMGKMTMSEYIEFSKTIDLAVSPMMAPHPNYPTLEFASIGTAVVTTKYANKVDLSDYSKNIVVSDIDIESIAGAINIAAHMKHDNRIKNLRASHINSSWTDALDAALKSILKQYS